MSEASRTVEGRKKHGRSRVSNGNQLFVDQVDGRSPIARRYRDLVAMILDDLGGPDHCSEIQIQLTRRFAGLAVQAETIEAALARGEAVALADHAQIASTLTRLSTRLGIGRRAKDIVPTLEAYVAQREAGK